MEVEGVPQSEIVKDSLLRMADSDQAVLMAEGRRDPELDKEHVKQLEQIIEDFGWPTVSRVGTEGSQAAWLLAQHADHDVEFQQRVLELLIENQDDIDKGQIAYLDDRIRVNQGQPQLYGTQFIGTGESFGPREIENPEGLDERRKQYGLEPFTEYEQRMRENFNRYEEARKNE